MGEVQTLDRGSTWPQYGASIIVNIISFAYGTVMGWSANALPILQSASSPIDGDPLDNDEASWIGSLVCLGALASTPAYSYIAQRMGRKVTGYTIAVPFIVSWVIMICANSTAMLYLSRITVGISSGGLLILCPLYVAEIAEDSIRGLLGTMLPFFINAGILFAFLIGPVLSLTTTSIIYLAIPILFLVTFPFIPETPISLLGHDKEAEATKALMWLRRKKNVDEEMIQLKASVKEMKGASSQLRVADLTNRATVKGIIIGVGLCANQQLCGIFAIITYAVAIFQESGSDMTPTMATILVGVLQLCSSVVAAVLMDRAGRKLLVIISNSAMAICLASIGTFSYLKSNGTNLESFGWVPVMSLSLYIISFSLGLGPVPFVMIGEIFAPKVRGVASTLSLCTVWFLAFAVAKLYSDLTAVLGFHGCYWLFSACCVIGVVFAIYFVPETKNRSLESILQELNGMTTKDAQGKGYDCALQQPAV